MISSHARVRTDRAGRYLAQLCAHGRHLTRVAHQPSGHDAGGPPLTPLHATCSDTEGIIDFGWGRCILHAAGDELVLRAEADDEPRLRRIQEAVARRLELIGRRDELIVSWATTG